MNWIEKMIAEQCPNGVKKVKLGNVAMINRGKRVVRKELSKNGSIPVFQNSLRPLGFHSESNYPAYTPFVISAGAAGEVGFSDIPFWAADDCLVLAYKKDANGKYFYHYLKTKEQFLKNQIRGGAIKRLSRDVVENLEIPLPPLSIQEEIVSVLDKFSELIEKTDEEIALRQKQYEYYREKLLTFEKGEVEWKKIPDVAKYSTGLTYKPANVTDNGTLVLRSSNIKDGFLAFDDNVYVTMDIPERAKVKKGDILICVRNGSKKLVGKCAIITEEADGMAFGAFMNILRAEKCDNKYLFYVWQKDSTVKQYKGDDASPICQITNKDFSRITIPIPSLSRQQEIVETLDKFETLISKLKEERELRQKQYEYYREKLLTF